MNQEARKAERAMRFEARTSLLAITVYKTCAVPIEDLSTLSKVRGLGLEDQTVGQLADTGVRTGLSHNILVSRQRWSN